MAAPCTRTSTSPSTGSGLGASSSWRTSGSPYSCIRTACMVAMGCLLLRTNLAVPPLRMAPLARNATANRREQGGQGDSDVAVPQHQAARIHRHLVGQLDRAPLRVGGRQWVSAASRIDDLQLSEVGFHHDAGAVQERYQSRAGGEVAVQ